MHLTFIRLNPACSSYVPSIKDVSTKPRKIDSLFVCKMSALIQPPLSVRIHHKLKNPKFLHQKVQTSASEELPFVCKIYALDLSLLQKKFFYVWFSLNRLGLQKYEKMTQRNIYIHI